MDTDKQDKARNDSMNFWDSFQDAYTTYADCQTFSSFATLCSMSQIWYSKNILELSCGGGSGIIYLTNLCKQPSTFICSGDFSKNMLEYTYKRLQNEKNPNFLLSPTLDLFQDIGKGKQFNIEEIKKSELVENKDSSMIKLLQCDNEEICFEDSSFDVVISSLSLHLVSSAEKMVKECARVLSPKGKAVFSVWGRPQNSPMFTLLNDVLKENNVPLPTNRSGFYLCEPEKLMPVILENGFERVHYSYSVSPFPYREYEVYYNILVKNNPILKNLEENLRIKVEKEVKEKYDQIVTKNNGFIESEYLQILCLK